MDTGQDRNSRVDKIRRVGWARQEGQGVKDRKCRVARQEG